MISSSASWPAGTSRFRERAGLDAQPARLGRGGQRGRIGGEPIQAGDRSAAQRPKAATSQGVSVLGGRPSRHARRAARLALDAAPRSTQHAPPPTWPTCRASPSCASRSAGPSHDWALRAVLEPPHARCLVAVDGRGRVVGVGSGISYGRLGVVGNMIVDAEHPATGHRLGDPGVGGRLPCTSVASDRLELSATPDRAGRSTRATASSSIGSERPWSRVPRASTRGGRRHARACRRRTRASTSWSPTTRRASAAIGAPLLGPMLADADRPLVVARRDGSARRLGWVRPDGRARRPAGRRYARDRRAPRRRGASTGCRRAERCAQPAAGQPRRRRPARRGWAPTLEEWGGRMARGPDVPRREDTIYAQRGGRARVTTTTGLVLRARSGFYTVATAEGDLVEARLRGRVKKERQASDLAVIGDRVTRRAAARRHRRDRLRRAARASLQPSPAGAARVVARGRDGGQPRPGRRRLLVRSPDPEPAADRPLPGRGRVQRGPRRAGRATRWTSSGADAAAERFAPYERIGYDVVYTSAETGTGLEELRERLAGRLSIVTGPSGVGKSTLLNALQPGLQLATGEVSARR